MKEIKANIQPEMFETVYNYLRAEGYHSIRYYTGEGIGRHGSPDKLNASLVFPFLRSYITKIEIFVKNEHEEEDLQIIQHAACTYSVGDGFIYSLMIDELRLAFMDISEYLAQDLNNLGYDDETLYLHY